MINTVKWTLHTVAYSSEDDDGRVDGHSNENSSIEVDESDDSNLMPSDDLEGFKSKLKGTSSQEDKQFR